MVVENPNETVKALSEKLCCVGYFFMLTTGARRKAMAADSF